jgi:hypothetical protein
MVKWSDIQNETNPKARRMALSDALRHASDDEMQQLLELASQDPDAAVRAVAKNWDVLQERLVTPPADETDPPPPRLSGPVRLPNVQVFMLRTGNAAYFQGQVARPSDFGVVKNTLGSIVTALLLFACGVGLLLYGGNDGLTWLLLRAEGMSTTATVTNRNGQSAGESSFVYTVTYRYQVNERMYTIERIVDEPLFRSVDVGSSLPILYARTDPQRAWPTEQAHAVPWGVVWSLGLAVLWFVIVAGIVAMMRRNSTKSRLSRGEGQAVYGMIQTANLQADEDVGYYLHITYDFVSPTSGKLLQGKDQATRADLGATQNAPAPHTHVIVWYRDEETHGVV